MDVCKQEVRGAALTGNIVRKTVASEMPTVVPSVPSSGLREPQTYGPCEQTAGRR